jgi:nitrite reductase/ring-hydroxylating ferredoxin subunit
MMTPMLQIATLDQIPPEGLRFRYHDGPFEEEGLLLRTRDGRVVAYKNECRHLPMPLDDRDPGVLWDDRRVHLVCSAHAAMYRPDDGLCVSGPPEGSHLRSLPILVDGERVLLDESKLGGFFNV